MPFVESFSLIFYSSTVKIKILHEFFTFYFVQPRPRYSRHFQVFSLVQKKKQEISLSHVSMIRSKSHSPILKYLRALSPIRAHKIALNPRIWADSRSLVISFGSCASRITCNVVFSSASLSLSLIQIQTGRGIFRREPNMPEW